MLDTPGAGDGAGDVTSVSTPKDLPSSHPDRFSMGTTSSENQLVSRLTGGEMSYSGVDGSIINTNTGWEKAVDQLKKDLDELKTETRINHHRECSQSGVMLLLSPMKIL